NNGTRIPKALLAQTIQELEDEFGAVSCETQVIQGRWRSGDQAYRETSVIPTFAPTSARTPVKPAWTRTATTKKPTALTMTAMATLTTSMATISSTTTTPSSMAAKTKMTMAPTWPAPLARWAETASGSSGFAGT